jgi:hypothetical protein
LIEIVTFLYRYSPAEFTMTANLPLSAASPVAIYPTLPIDNPVEPMAAALLPLTQPPQGWLGQLRAYYPTGTLVAELLQIHAANFVVRALVQVDGVTVVTAMAAAEQIEVAEDTAQFRALARLGIVPQLGPTRALEPEADPASALAGATANGVPPLAVADQPVGRAIAPPTPKEPPIAKSPSTKSPSTKSPSTKSDAKSNAQSEPAAAKLALVEPVINLPTLEKSPVKVPTPGPAPAPEVALDQGSVLDQDIDQAAAIANSGTAAAIPTLTDAPVDRETTPLTALGDGSGSPDPIDLSDAIAQIGAEIERIGWNKKQGSAHLQKTYSKRTRAELTEEELLEFLSYLKSLPSQEQAGLSPVPF